VLPITIHDANAVQIISLQATQRPVPDTLRQSFGLLASSGMSIEKQFLTVLPLLSGPSLSSH